MKTRALLTATLVALILLAPLCTFGQTTEDRWTFSVMPQLWLPSVDGKLNYGQPPSGGASADVSIDADNLLDNLDLAFMINGEARKNRWLIATDVIYMDFSKTDSAVRSVDFNIGPGPINLSTTGLNAGTQSSLDALVWTLVGGYTAVQKPRATLDLIAGFRYLGAEAWTDRQLTATVTGTGPLGNTATFARTGSVEQSEDIWTVIVGAKGRLKLGGSNWFVPYYGDIGGGSSAFTWQGAVGIGQAFRWDDVRLDYRYMYYDQSSDKLFQELSFGGFALGVNLVF